MIICAGRNESFEFATSVGVGMVEPALNLSRILLTNSVSELIFVATAGIYKDGKIGEIYESAQAANVEISALYSQSYTPISTDVTGIVSRGTIKINSSNFITTDSAAAGKFFELGYKLENMEFYSILMTANYYKVPCYGIFCTTNFCHQLARKEFIASHEKAKKTLTNYVKSKGLI